MRITLNHPALLDQLFNEVKTYTGYTSEVLKGKSRITEVVLARSLFCLFARRYMMATYPALGRYLNRHHTSILNMVNTLEGYLDYDSITIQYVDQFKKQLNEKGIHFKV